MRGLSYWVGEYFVFPWPRNGSDRRHSDLTASLVVQLVQNLPAMQETLFQFLGWEDPLEEGMATHSSILA